MSTTARASAVADAAGGTAGRWDPYARWAPRSPHGAAAAAALVAAVVVVTLVPVLFFDRFYFVDDTQVGAYGQWYEIGKSLLAGHVPFFEPSRWMAGNFAVEGQWGIFNPLMMAIGLGATAATNLVLYATVVKIVFFVVAAGGWYLVMRSYGATLPWSLVGAVMSVLTGFTVYMDGASWVTGLMVWALLPWPWWALRRLAAGRTSNPFPAFAAGYLLVTIGYVHGTIMLALVIAAVVVEALVASPRGAWVKVLVAGSLLGLVAVAVYLPGVLSASVTVRDGSGIENDNFMSPDLSGLATSWIATARPWMSGFWGLPTPGPLMYVSWLLPAVLFVRPSTARRVLSGMLGVIVVGAVSAVLVLGPSLIGPLRFPARLLPYLATCLLVVLVVLLSQALVERPSRRRIGVVAAVVAVGAYFAFAETPGWWGVYAVSALLSLAGVVGVGLLLRRGMLSGRAILVVGLSVTLLCTVYQHAKLPRSPLPDYGLPGTVAEYEKPLPGVTGSVFVVGHPTDESIAAGTSLYANSWYLNDAEVQNTYSPVGFRAYWDRLCMDAHGGSCWDSLGTLLSVDDVTGQPLVDLMGVDAIQIVARTDGGQPDPFAEAAPPAGWHESQRTATGAVWQRDTQSGPVGDVTWASDGVSFSDVEVTDRTTTFEVSDVPAGGGDVVISRLPWPGYTVSNARLADPVEGYLMRLHLPEGTSGTVTVSFSPPGWTVSLLALVGGTGAALLWGAAAVVAGARRRYQREG